MTFDPFGDFETQGYLRNLAKEKDLDIVRRLEHTSFTTGRNKNPDLGVADAGGISVICISGLRPNRKPFIIVDMLCGAWGGRPDKDGVEAITNASQNLSNTPVEVLEAEHPVRVEDYCFIPDSCGAGRWRGGVGIRRSYRILAPEALLQLRSDRVAFRPYGLDGGEEGAASRSTIEIDGKTKPIPAKVTMTVEQGTLIIHEQAGAGGFGDPLKRPTQLVLEDLLNGKVTADFAKDRHGVVMTEAGTIDEWASEKLRSDRGVSSSEGNGG